MPDRCEQQFANYRLVELLGTGGFAEVYLGEHIYLEKKKAALKLLSAKISSKEVDDFKKEARMISSLDEHPHIVCVFDFGVQDNVPYLVMSYAPSGTLRDKHPKGTKLPLSTIVPYVKQVAEALQHAHDHKLIHRDVKPQNMLLGEKGDVLLSDFGIALIAQTYQPRQDRSGTLAYMAPEQMQGHPCFASDQYALGIVVYEWLCGKLPFRGTEVEVIAQHLNAKPPALRDILPDLPPAFEDVVMKALAKKSEDRFPSVQDFAMALEEAWLASQLDEIPTGPLPFDPPDPHPLTHPKGSQDTTQRQTPNSSIPVPDPIVPPPPLSPMPNWGKYEAKLTEEAKQIIMRDNLGSPLKVYKPPNIWTILRGLILMAIGLSLFWWAFSLIPNWFAIIILILIGLGFIGLSLRKIIQLISNPGMRVVLCTHGIALIDKTGSKSFYWQDVEKCKKNLVNLSLPDIPKQLYIPIILVIIVILASPLVTLAVVVLVIVLVIQLLCLLCFQRSYTVSCSNSDDKFVFRDSLSPLQNLPRKIEDSVTHVKGAPRKSGRGTVQWL